MGVRWANNATTTTTTMVTKENNNNKSEKKGRVYGDSQQWNIFRYFFPMAPFTTTGMANVDLHL